MKALIRWDRLDLLQDARKNATAAAKDEVLAANLDTALADETEGLSPFIREAHLSAEEHAALRQFTMDIARSLLEPLIAKAQWKGTMMKASCA